MKRNLMLSLLLMVITLGMSAHPINSFKYIIIETQEDSPKDIEKRLEKDFTEMGFDVICANDLSSLSQEEKDQVLTAHYLCRQSGECLFRLTLKDVVGNTIYEDEQISGEGFMSRKNDRQSAIKKIFKQLKKLNYTFIPTE